jgi:heptosyltransferase-2
MTRPAAGWEHGRILAVKLADFGDALLVTPALRALRTRYPHARLDALTTAAGAEVLSASGLVDEIHVVDARTADRRRALPSMTVARKLVALRRRGYHAVALFQRVTSHRGGARWAALCAAVGAPVRAGLASPRGGTRWWLTHPAPDPGFDVDHAVEAGLAVAGALGAPAAGTALAFVPGGAATATAASLLDSRLGAAAHTVVALHPGGGTYSTARRWPVARFAALAAALLAEGIAVALVGTAADDTAAVRDEVATMRRGVPAGGAPLLDFTAAGDLRVLGALLARVALLVTNDSGVMHLATAVGTPVVAIFGPSNPVAWGPWHPGPGPSPHRVVALPLPCRPCFYVDHRLGSPDGCPTRDCLAWLGVERVRDAVRAVLAERPRSAATGAERA